MPGIGGARASGQTHAVGISSFWKLEIPAEVIGIFTWLGYLPTAFLLVLDSARLNNIDP
jgi:hypothetical protein